MNKNTTYMRLGATHCCLVLLLLLACKPLTGSVTIEGTTLDTFTEKFKQTQGNYRPLYEEYIDGLGANVILETIETLKPQCHTEAHDLGKVIFAKLQDISQSLRICGTKCHTGCMHGVLMEAFTGAQTKEGHVDLSKLKESMNSLCFDNTEMVSIYGPGECAHGIGHAVMFLHGYDIPEALTDCAAFERSSMEYYCATGAYMEYNFAHARDETPSIFYPCDSFDYPSACMLSRYGFVAMNMHKQGKTHEDMKKECKKLEGKYRRGCFHGLGDAYMQFIASGAIKLTELCSKDLTEEEQHVCIEGVMEVMGKYKEDDVSKTCEHLEESQKELCINAAGHKLYSLEKDLALYPK